MTREEQIAIGIPLARQYVAASGLSPAKARAVLAWLLPGPLISDETLSPVDVDAYRAADGQFYEYLAAGAERDDPRVVAVVRTLQAIERRSMDAKAERRDATVATLLRGDNGRRVIDPVSWLASTPAEAQRSPIPEITLLLGLTELDEDPGEMSVPGSAVPRSELASSAIVAFGTQLGDRIVLPRALIDGGYSPRVGAERKLAQIQQGDLFALPDTVAILEEAASMTVERTQLGALSPSEVRALIAIYRLFSSSGDANGAFERAAIRAEASVIYRAAQVDPHDGSACRRIFQAICSLSTREIRVALKFKYGDGWGVAGDRCSVFIARPLWRAHSSDGRRRRTEDDVSQIADAWTRGRELIGGKPIPLPDAYDISLPKLMQKVWHSLVLCGDILQRLDAGAKAVRGQSERFTGLDARLFMEITQRIQPSQLGAQGTTLRSYVNRDALLSDYYGPDTVKHARARGKYHGRLVTQYEKAVACMEAGGLARRVEKQKPNRRGAEPDVFEPNPAAIHGLGERAAFSESRLAKDTAHRRARKTRG